MKQSTLGAALAAVLAAKGEVPASATMNGVKVKLTPLQRAFNKVKEDADTYFEDAAQSAALADYVKMALVLKTDVDNVREQCFKGIAKLFPDADNPPSWNQVDVLKRSLGLTGRDPADYVYQQTVKGIRRLVSLGATYKPNGEIDTLGELPAKSGGRKKGKREKSVGRYQTSVAKDLQTMRKRMTDYKRVIDPEALKLYAEAFKMLGNALKLDRKAS